jgi:hypothetical protein
MSDTPNKQPLLDAEGRQMYDENGNPLYKEGTPPGKNDAFNKYLEDKFDVIEEDEYYRVEESPTMRRIVRKATHGNKAEKVEEEYPLNNQYMNEAARELSKQNEGNILLASQDFGKFERQSRRDSGLYTAEPGKANDLEDFKLRHEDWINELYHAGAGGYGQFIKDMTSKDAKTSRQATLWLQRSYNEQFRKKYGKNYFIEGGKGADAVDGMPGHYTLSMPRIVTPPPAVESPAVPAKEKEITVEDQGFAQAGQPDSDGWWLQDIANMAATLTDKVNRYEPMHQQVDLKSPDYSLMDPSRQVAAVQEQQHMYGNLVENTASGQVARASMLGAAGQAGAQVADILSSYENQNVGISNTGAQQGAEVYNKQMEMNAQLNDQYVSRMATLNQNYDNSVNERKYRQLNAFINGATNNMHKKMLEQVVFPDVHTDPITFNTSIAPSGRKYYGGYDTYQHPQGGNIGYDPEDTAVATATAQRTYYDALINSGKFTPEQAMKLLEKSGTSLGPNASDSRKGGNTSRGQEWMRMTSGSQKR